MYNTNSKEPLKMNIAKEIEKICLTKEEIEIYLQSIFKETLMFDHKIIFKNEEEEKLEIEYNKKWRYKNI